MTSILQKKVDFPPPMVRAHQAAYAFMNQNISKYETLLGLLDQAAQTQLSLQPMISALMLRFEEINQALEEMLRRGIDVEGTWGLHGHAFWDDDPPLLCQLNLALTQPTLLIHFQIYYNNCSIIQPRKLGLWGAQSRQWVTLHWTRQWNVFFYF
ncbi:unnamed protein product [Pleuronectes platessa]|uniref:Uncharacterized protein n=1 Tax=Pleuronectes platessa TaxID=8262 RepID=A0A9N7UTF8_PLEPL|nr:unnamed protein product [Pleuronectes platessa]